MEATEEAAATMAAGTKDLANIVKGKRTKRQRPQSPIPFTITTQLSSGEGGYGSNEDMIINSNKTKNIKISSSSPAASSDESAMSTTTEDEDTARLLILLAQGNSRESSSTKNNNNQYHDKDQDYAPSYKFNSKKYIETSSTGNGKSGMYVYECKTCNRTFPSFQALGGHRASHKKPKNLALMAAAEEKKQFFAFSDDDETPFKNNSSLASPLSYQTSNSNTNKSSSSKIHECSYCGAEFTSGQALGGHMRRHRGSNGGAPAVPLSPLSPLSVNQDSEEAKKMKNGLALPLDLNLPAPEDDHSRSEPKFAAFVAKQQHQHQQQSQQQKKEPALLISTTLVDCHY